MNANTNRLKATNH